LKVGSSQFGRGREYSILKIILHELFFAPEFYHDIAIIVTKSAFNFNSRIRPVCIPNQDISSDDLLGLLATVVGFGDTVYKGFFSQTLQQIQVPIVSNRECAQSYANADRRKMPIGIQECMICAGSQYDGRDACQGDSGGPMTVTINGIDFLIGVISFGHKCGSNGFPGVYTNVAYYRKWIFNTIHRHESYVSS
jgi:secreted trypsin-like serine protease